MGISSTYVMLTVREGGTRLTERPKNNRYLPSVVNYDGEHLSKRSFDEVRRIFTLYILNGISRPTVTGPELSRTIFLFIYLTISKMDFIVFSN